MFSENETLEDVAMFCMKCKKKVQHLYDVNENVQKTAKAFEDLRDGIANTIARTFVHHKMLSEDTPKPESAEIETEKITRTNSLLQGKPRFYFITVLRLVYYYFQVEHCNLNSVIFSLETYLHRRGGSVTQRT